MHVDNAFKNCGTINNQYYNVMTVLLGTNISNTKYDYRTEKYHFAIICSIEKNAIVQKKKLY